MKKVLLGCILASACLALFARQSTADEPALDNSVTIKEEIVITGKKYCCEMGEATGTVLEVSTWTTNGTLDTTHLGYLLVNYEMPEVSVGEDLVVRMSCVVQGEVAGHAAKVCALESVKPLSRL